MTFLQYLESIYHNTLVRKARNFAQEKHQGQMRKDGKPYFTHPDRVAKIVAKNKKSKNKDALVAAAYLHDTIEDTATTIDEIRELFGDLVANIVGELTSDKEQIQKTNKTDYLIKKMSGMSNYALYAKLSDRLDNISDLHKSSPEFRERYTKETKNILEQLSASRQFTKSQQRIINQIYKKLSKLN